MRALVNTPKKQTLVEFQDVAEPQAALNEAIVDVKAFSLNRGELMLLSSRPEGWRPGQDIAGIVTKAAADGSGPKEGTRVVGRVDEAGWSQRVAVQTISLAALPERVSFSSASTLPVAGLTALRLVRLGGFLLGHRVLVTGASGAVGRFAIQLATIAGADVTGVVSKPEHVAGLKESGASQVVTSMQEAENGKPFDLILESIGGETLARAIRVVAPDGLILVFGYSSQQDTTINFPMFAGHAGARIQSFFSYLAAPPEATGPDLSVLVSLIEQGKLKAEIGMEKSWTDLAAGVDALRNRQVSGKVVFDVN